MKKLEKLSLAKFAKAKIKNLTQVNGGLEVTTFEIATKTTAQSTGGADHWVATKSSGDGSGLYGIHSINDTRIAYD